MKRENEQKALRSVISMVGSIAKLMDVLGEHESVDEKNRWKKRYLSYIPGIEFPDDFDSLPEEEKARRLDKAIETATKPVEENNDDKAVS